MLAKFSLLNRKGPYLSLEKESDNVYALLTYSIKWVHEIRKFHVAVVQQWLRNVQKKLLFFQTKPVAFFLLQKLPIVVIRKFCHHSKVHVTSHFSRLLEGE